MSTWLTRVLGEPLHRAVLALGMALPMLKRRTKPEGRRKVAVNVKAKSKASTVKVNLPKAKARPTARVKTVMGSAKADVIGQANVVSDARLGKTAKPTSSVRATLMQGGRHPRSSLCPGVNAGDCGDSEDQPPPPRGRLLSQWSRIHRGRHATVDNLIDALVCLRINGGNCGTAGAAPTGGGRQHRDTILPPSAPMYGHSALGGSAWASPSTCGSCI